jgi:hypothetical protein
MAYPTVSSPYGLKPINLIGGQPYAGSTRAFKIASGYNQSIFFGDVVKIKRTIQELLGGKPPGVPVDGTIEVQNFCYAGYVFDNTFREGVMPFGLGVFVGCSYTDPVLKYQLFSQSFPAGLVANDIVAYVVDDPDALFKTVFIADPNYYTASTNGIITGTTVGATGADVLGSNLLWVYNGGNTDNGNSLSGVTNVTSSSGPLYPTVAPQAPFRVVT